MPAVEYKEVRNGKETRTEEKSTTNLQIYKYYKLEIRNPTTVTS